MSETTEENLQKKKDLEKFWGKKKAERILDRKKLARKKQLEVVRKQARAEVLPDTAFNPTDQMLKFLDVITSPMSGNSVQDWSEKSGISLTTIETWRRNPEFAKWIAREFEKNLDIYKIEWMKTGLMKMQFDFKHWAEMGKVLYPKGLEFGADTGKRKELEADLLGIFKANLKKIDNE